MNKHDFYKEIMSRYTFDEDKILKNAKRASSVSFLARSSKWLPLTTAAAVFVAVFGVYMLFGTYFMNNGGDDLISGSGASVEDRLSNLEQLWTAINNDDFNAQNRTLYLSFEAPLTYSQLDNILQAADPDDSSGLYINALWNGGFVPADTAKGDTAAVYTGAKINAHATRDLIIALSARAEFSAVELDDVTNDDNFSPIVKTPPIQVTPTPVDPPVEPVEPITPTPTPIDTPPETEPTTLEQPPSGEEELEPTEEPIEEPLDEPVVDPEPEEEPEVVEEPDPEEETEVDPEPDPTENLTIEVELEGALSVNFLSDNRFLVLAEDGIYIYEINPTTRQVSNKSAFKNENVAYPTIIYTDAASGSRVIKIANTEMFIACGTTGKLHRIDISRFANSVITDVIYSNGMLVVATENAGQYAIHTARELDGWGFFKIIESGYRLVPVSLSDKELIYAESSSSLGYMFRYVFAEYESHEIDLSRFDVRVSHGVSFKRDGRGQYTIITTNIGDMVWCHETNALIRDTNTPRTVFSNTYRLLEISPEKIIIKIIS
ncbi:MAG: hypothetical protein FWH20_01720 [Oscillospiraceae bacterium]|nr:hypothetical protein [Oscillospiraceae bacterium]